jgi:hypothetical protein
MRAFLQTGNYNATKNPLRINELQSRPAKPDANRAPVVALALKPAGQSLVFTQALNTLRTAKMCHRRHF